MSELIKHSVLYKSNDLFIRACIDNNIELVKQLLEKNKNNLEYINLKHNIWNARNWTVLMIASWYGHTEIVMLLLKAGANIDLQNKYGWTALEYALELEHKKIIKILKKMIVVQILNNY